MTDREQFEDICDLTTKLVGLPQGSLAQKTRRQTYHIPRMAASVVARLVSDIHPVTIANVIERDRTSILHYEKTHKHNYASFPKYREVFTKVYNAYSSILGTKKLFYDTDTMRMHLIKSGIKLSSSKPQVKIKVVSNKVKYMLPTNYFDFSNNVDIIRDCMRDYNYSIEIIAL